MQRNRDLFYPVLSSLAAGKDNHKDELLGNLGEILLGPATDTSSHRSDQETSPPQFPNSPVPLAAACSAAGWRWRPSPRVGIAPAQPFASSALPAGWVPACGQLSGSKRIAFPIPGIASPILRIAFFIPGIAFPNPSVAFPNPSIAFPIATAQHSQVGPSNHSRTR